MNFLARTSWSPYVVGAGIGVLSWIAFASADHPIGITTAFENTAALLGKAALPAVTDHQYFQEAEQSPKIDWEWMLVLGVFVGSYLSSRLSEDRTDERVPPLWEWRFGGSRRTRFMWAFLGAALMMFGARVAKGCTSGHAISGTLQLAVSSWIFAAVIFAVAVATAFALYGRKGSDHV
ncbi:MAG: hypothetical protein NPIRA01_28070 [Nitrospirales bacterium]|nr:MAG: hypothetical protein NPIRA01_28070 [Nitrospirales bacterium]